MCIKSILTELKGYEPPHTKIGSHIEYRKDIYNTVYCAEVTLQSGDYISKVDFGYCR